jgi:hypothetical protein
MGKTCQRFATGSGARKNPLEPVSPARAELRARRCWYTALHNFLSGRTVAMRAAANYRKDFAPRDFVHSLSRQHSSHDQTAERCADNPSPNPNPPIRFGFRASFLATICGAHGVPRFGLSSIFQRGIIFAPSSGLVTPSSMTKGLLCGRGLRVITSPNLQRGLLNRSGERKRERPRQP